MNIEIPELGTIPTYKSKFTLETLPPLPKKSETLQWLYKKLWVLKEVLHTLTQKCDAAIAALVEAEQYELCKDLKNNIVEVQKDLSWITEIMRQIEDKKEIPSEADMDQLKVMSLQQRYMFIRDIMVWQNLQE